MKLRGDQGSAAVELVMIAPALLLLIAVIVGSGRIVSTKSAVESVAREAARSASDASDSISARERGEGSASEAAEGLGLDPLRLQVATDAGDFNRGDPLTVRVTYEVRLADLPGFGLLPGSFAVSARHTEIVERHKSR